ELEGIVISPGPKKSREGNRPTGFGRGGFGAIGGGGFQPAGFSGGIAGGAMGGGGMAGGGMAGGGMDVAGGKGAGKGSTPGQHTAAAEGLPEMPMIFLRPSPEVRVLSIKS